MNWEEVGAIGQVLGSVAVFLTLGYLAVQLRHARAEVRRSISQARSVSNREFGIYRASNQELITISAKAHRALGGDESSRFWVQLKERAGLTHEEASRLFWDQFAAWHDKALTVSYMKELSAGERAQFDTFIRNSYGSFSPVGHLWYETTKHTLNPDAVRYIDKLLAQPALTPS